MTLAINASDDFQIMLDDFGVSLDISDGDDPVNKIELTAIGGELKFSEHLSKVFIRRSCGTDIAAACGQLALSE